MICWITTVVVAIATAVFVYYYQKTINLQSFLAQKKEHHQKNLDRINDLLKEADYLSNDNEKVLATMGKILSELKEIKFPKEKYSEEAFEVLGREISLVQQYNDARARYFKNTERLNKIVREISGADA